MSDPWARRPLGELATFLSGGTPRKTQPEFWGGEVPWISGASLKSTRLHRSDRRLTELGVANGSRLAPLGASLILVRGMSLLDEIRIGYAMRPLAFNQDVKALVAVEGVDPWFLTYALLAQTQKLLGIVHQAAHGTGVLATDRLKSLSIPLPPLAEQRRIAGALGVFDDLIAAERASTLDLDHLVKLAGQGFIASLDGREMAPLGEVAVIQKGYSYKSSELVPGDGWLVSLKNIGRDGTFKTRGFKPLTATPKAHHIVDTGDVLVAQTDLTQNRDVIGRPVRVRRGLARGQLVASLDLVIVRPGPTLTREYLYAVLDSDSFRSHALGYCNGTTVVHMATAAIPNFAAPIPDQLKLDVFSTRVRTISAEADAAFQSAERLSQQRDELLPLLLSGAIRVDEVAA